MYYSAQSIERSGGVVVRISARHTFSPNCIPVTHVYSGLNTRVNVQTLEVQINDGEVEDDG